MRSPAALMLLLLAAAVAPAVDFAAPPVARLAAFGNRVLGPADVYRAAAADILTVPLADRKDTRYLTRYHKSGNARILENDWHLTSFAANSLSFRKRIELTEPVSGTGGWLLRLNMRHYGWKTKDWEDLARIDPYFHARALRTTTTTVIKRVVVGKKWWPAGVFNGKPYKAGFYDRFENKPVVVKVAQVQETITSGAIDARDVVALKLHTGSEGPVLRSDWFYATALKPPFYEKFLGLEKTEAAFQRKNVAAALREVERFEADAQGTVTFSGVTTNNRRLTRIPTITGYYWFSTDADSSIDAQNYLNILLDRKKANFKASEQIFSLPNGLQGYALFDNNGRAQQKVPAEIASNYLATGHDPHIYNGLSCMICHQTGILSFRSVFKDLIQPGTAQLEPADVFKRDRILQLYGADLDEHFDDDQRRYHRAVIKATGGWSGPIVSTQLRRIHDDFADQPVYPEDAAAELGVTLEEARSLLFRVHRGPVILGLFGKAGLPARRDQFEREFADALQIIANAHRRR